MVDTIFRQTQKRFYLFTVKQREKLPPRTRKRKERRDSSRQLGGGGAACRVSIHLTSSSWLA